MPYVVTAPESIAAVYKTWPQCKAAVSGVPGARFMRVETDEEAEAILAGHGVVLEPGMYAFTDGNGLGGVGVVLVRMQDSDAAEPQVLQEIASTTHRVFHDATIPGLDPARAKTELGQLKNILAEMAALYVAISHLPNGSEVTIVHDYAGVGAFMKDEWQANNRTVKAIVSASWALARSKGLELHFRHQHGHRSTWAGRNDFVKFNGHADKLARESSSSSGEGEDT